MVFDEIDAPQFLAGFSLETDQDIAHAGDEESSIRIGRGGSNPIAVGFGEEGHLDVALPFMAPAQVAGRPVEGQHGLGQLVGRFGDEHQLAGDDRAGVAGAQGRAPDRFELVFLQAGRPGSLGDPAIPVGSTPLGPVGPQGGVAGTDQRQKQGQCVK